MKFELTKGISLLDRLGSTDVALSITAKSGESYYLSILASGLNNSSYCCYRLKSTDEAPEDFNLSCRIYSDKLFRLMKRNLEIVVSESMLSLITSEGEDKDVIEYGCLRSVASGEQIELIDSIFRGLGQGKVYNLSNLHPLVKILSSPGSMLVSNNGKSMATIPDGGYVFANTPDLPNFTCYGRAVAMLLGISSSVEFIRDFIVYKSDSGSLSFAVKRTNAYIENPLDLILKQKPSHVYKASLSNCLKNIPAFNYEKIVMNFSTEEVIFEGKLGFYCSVRFNVFNREYGVIKNTLEEGVKDAASLFAVKTDDLELIVTTAAFSCMRNLFKSTGEVTVSVKRSLVLFLNEDYCVALPKRIKK